MVIHKRNVLSLVSARGELDPLEASDRQVRELLRGNFFAMITIATIQGNANTEEREWSLRWVVLEGYEKVKPYLYVFIPLAVMNPLIGCR